MSTPRNAVLLSIRPKFADLIFSGKKTIELRRVLPKIEKGDLVLVYESAPVKALRGAFEVVGVLRDTPAAIWRKVRQSACVSQKQFDDYFDGVDHACAILLGTKWVFGERLTLEMIRRHDSRFRPPQSFSYLTSERAVALGMADLLCALPRRIEHRVKPRGSTLRSIGIDGECVP